MNHNEEINAPGQVPQEPKGQERTLVAVLFRRWSEEDGGNVIALFPERAGDRTGNWCDAYENGQFSIFNVDDIEATVPVAVSPQDVSDMARVVEELSAHGFELDFVRQITPEMHARRQANARELLTEFKFPEADDSSLSDPAPDE